MIGEFVKQESGKYIEVTYNSLLPKISTKHSFNSSQLYSSEEEADLFIIKAKEIHSLMSDYIIKEKLPFKVDLVMLIYFPVIDSISSGLDIRSKMSSEEIAVLFVNGYKKKYNEALEFCNSVIKRYVDGAYMESYTKHWRDYDKHNELVDEFQLDLRKFEDSDFKINLEILNKKASELIDMLFKKNNHEA